jgi:hypothetical protein
MTCYQQKYRSEADPLGSEQQIKRARKLARTLGSRICGDLSELLEHCCPYFAKKEELMAVVATVNQIRQREISNTDDEVRAYADQFTNETQVDAEPSKVSVERQTAKLVSVLKSKKNGNGVKKIRLPKYAHLTDLPEYDPAGSIKSGAVTVREAKKTVTPVSGSAPIRHRKNAKLDMAGWAARFADEAQVDAEHKTVTVTLAPKKR